MKKYGLFVLALTAITIAAAFGCGNGVSAQDGGEAAAQQEQQAPPAKIATFNSNGTRVTARMFEDGSQVDLVVPNVLTVSIERPYAYQGFEAWGESDYPASELPNAAIEFYPLGDKEVARRLLNGGEGLHWHSLTLEEGQQGKVDVESLAKLLEDFALNVRLSKSRYIWAREVGLAGDFLPTIQRTLEPEGRTDLIPLIPKN